MKTRKFPTRRYVPDGEFHRRAMKWDHPDDQFKGPKFKIGQRVRFNDTLRRYIPVLWQSLHGTVVGYNTDPKRVLVRWDGDNHASDPHIEVLALLPEGCDR